MKLALTDEDGNNHHVGHHVAQLVEPEQMPEPRIFLGEPVAFDQLFLGPVQMVMHNEFTGEYGNCQECGRG